MNAYIADMLGQPAGLRRLQMAGVRDVLGAVGSDLGAYSRIILTGMGSSYAALRPLWLALVESGTSAWLVDAAECLGHCTPLIDATTLVIAASQSGRSAEIVALCGEIRSRGGTILAITNDVTSPLGENAHAVIDINVGVEHAVSTKTYLNTLAVGVVLRRVFLGQPLDDALERTADGLEAYFETWQDRVGRLKANIGLPLRLFLLARGASLAAAEYGALISKEAARWPVEAQSAPQFRHGPLELADDRLTTIILAGTDPTARRHNKALHDDLIKLGAKSFWLDSEPDDGPFAIPHTGSDTWPILEAAPMQLLSVAIAELSGIQPGTFRHLKKVTTVL